MQNFLTRCLSERGGSRHCHVVAKDIFQETYGDLPPEKKEVVNTARFHTSHWHLNYEHTAVRAAKCAKDVTVPEDVNDLEAVCPPCLSLFELPEFQKMLLKP